MNEPTVESLARRLDQMERQNRCLMRLGAMTLIGMAALALMGQATPVVKEVEAERFVLRDASGMRRGVLGVGSDGVATLALVGAEAKAQLVLLVGPRGRPALWFHDKTGIRRIALGTLADGSPRLSLFDNAGKRRIIVDTLADGRGGLYLLDRNGQLRATLGSVTDGAAALKLNDTQGRIRAGLLVERDGSPGLTLFDKDAKTIWSAP
ncbi:MAG: hypothetical protein ACE5K9_07775 [Candidatus Methylomirabilales bacterium]